MNRTVPRALAFALIPVLLLLCGFSCDAPLSPGYRILKESREIRFVPGQPPALQIRARYSLLNSGTADLTFVDAIFPDEKSFGRKDLRVEVNGHAAAPESLPAEFQQEQPSALRIPLDPPWTRKRTREISIEYVFSSPGDSGPRITLSESDFHLGSRGWLPELQPPKHLLAPNPVRPKLTEYTVRVPADFLVLARGAAKGSNREGAEIAYRFELSAEDLAPFVVAGRYAAWPARGKPRSTVFWTAQPLTEDAAPAAVQISDAWKTLEKDFGALDKNITGPHIVESPGLSGHLPGEAGAEAAAFPGGAIVNPAAFALGTGSAQFLEIVSHALAHNWFGDEMYPSPDAAVGMGEGLPEYATIVIEEARRGSDARRRRIAEYLRRYDEARSDATETPLGVTTLSSPLAQRRIAQAKAPLFFAALEDACGAAPVRAGLAHLLAQLRGREVDYNDLRSALEGSTNRPLGAMFRQWLNNTGVPDDFRSRYQGAAKGDVAKK